MIHMDNIFYNQELIPNGHEKEACIGTAAGAGEDAAPSSVNVVLTDAGAAKVNVIKAVKDITGLGLKESKDIVDSCGTVKENVSMDEANEIKAKLEEAGATVEFK